MVDCKKKEDKNNRLCRVFDSWKKESCNASLRKFRNQCTLTSNDFSDYARSKGLKPKVVRGVFKVDVPQLGPQDFTKEEKITLLSTAI